MLEWVATTIQDAFSVRNVVGLIVLHYWLYTVPQIRSNLLKEQAQLEDRAFPKNTRRKWHRQRRSCHNNSKTLQRLQRTVPDATEQECRRFLLGKKGNVEMAIENLQQYMEWRASFDAWRNNEADTAAANPASTPPSVDSSGDGANEDTHRDTAVADKENSCAESEDASNKSGGDPLAAIKTQEGNLKAARSVQRRVLTTSTTENETIEQREDSVAAKEYVCSIASEDKEASPCNSKKGKERASVVERDEDTWARCARMALQASGETQVTCLPRVACTCCLEETEECRDLQGRRILQLLPGKINDQLVSSGTVKVYATAIALYLDEKLARDSLEKTCVVIDVRGGQGPEWPNPSASTLLPFVKDLVALLLSMFPERMGCCVVFPVPTHLWWIWTMIEQSCLDAETAQKINVLSGPNRITAPQPTQAMQQYLPTPVVDLMEKERLASQVLQS